MQIVNYLNFPSFVVCASVLAYGFVLSEKDKRKAFLIARDAAVPAGLIGTLIGCQQMLTNLQDPTAIGPALSVAYLTLLYGVAIMVFTNVAASLFPKLESGENQAPVLNAPRVATTVLLLFALLISAMLYGGHLLIFIDLTSLFCLAIFTIVPVFVEKVREGRSLLESKLLAARDYSLATTVIGILMAWIGILMNHGDPSAIGPCISIGFLISFYAGLIFMMSTMLYRASTGREIPHLGLTSTAYAVLATFATGSCYAYIFFLF